MNCSAGWVFTALWEFALRTRSFFETGLLLTVVPLAARWLGVALWQAFLLDIGLALFFLPYTFFFNLAYDHLRARFVA